MAYVTKDELRQHLGLRPEFVEDDAQIAVALAAAEAVVDDHCGRTFTEDATPTVRIYRAATVVNIEDVADTATATVEWSADRATWATYTGDYYFASAGQTWPATQWVALSSVGSGWLRITAKHGWADVPEAVKGAVKLVAAALLARRQSVNGVEFASDFGAIRASRYLDGTAEMMLRKYRRHSAFAGIG